MTRRRRAVLLLGLALVLGAIAASDVASREAAIDRRVGPSVPVLATRTAIAAGKRIEPASLAVRSVPERFAPHGAYAVADEVAGMRAAADLPAGSYVTAAAIRRPKRDSRPGVPVGRGERVAEVIAAGAPRAVLPGSRVDVLVTREDPGGDTGATTLALQDVEVLGAQRAPATGSSSASSAGPHVQASLRVTLAQAVYLAAAQAFAREIRLLPRAPGDHHHVRGELSVDQSLR